MLFTSYRWHLFILYDVIVLYFYFIYCEHHEAHVLVQRSVFVVKPPRVQMFLCRGQLLLVDLLRNRCYSSEVFLFGF